eukprot:GHVU01132045.1.p1 GENE.GHVU01132045.1~~GHVU01132045.1.p1  ORF type:complete len:204 (+),score=6.97 GHVU01132045.1:410-1021(+)
MNAMLEELGERPVTEEDYGDDRAEEPSRGMRVGNAGRLSAVENLLLHVATKLLRVENIIVIRAVYVELIDALLGRTRISACLALEGQPSFTRCTVVPTLGGTGRRPSSDTDHARREPGAVTTTSAGVRDQFDVAGRGSEFFALERVVAAFKGPIKVSPAARLYRIAARWRGSGMGCSFYQCDMRMRPYAISTRQMLHVFASWG